MSFGQTLRRLREQAGLTQIALAHNAGLSLRSVQNWEQGHRTPRLDTILALTKALNISADRLLAKEDASAAIPKKQRKPAERAVTARAPSQRRKGRRE